MRITSNVSRAADSRASAPSETRTTECPSLSNNSLFDRIVLRQKDAKRSHEFAKRFHNALGDAVCAIRTQHHRPRGAANVWSCRIRSASVRCVHPRQLDMQEGQAETANAAHYSYQFLADREVLQPPKYLHFPGPAAKVTMIGRPHQIALSWYGHWSRTLPRGLFSENGHVLA